jgi:hypothetical protein
MKLRINTIGRTKNPNGVEIRTTRINVIRNATTLASIATVFSIVVGVVSRKLLSIAILPSVKYVGMPATVATLEYVATRCSTRGATRPAYSTSLLGVATRST